MRDTATGAQRHLVHVDTHGIGSLGMLPQAIQPHAERCGEMNQAAARATTITSKNQFQGQRANVEGEVGAVEHALELWK